MNVELYVSLLEGEVYRLREKVDSLETDLVQRYQAEAKRLERAGASANDPTVMAPIHVDTTKFSRETQEHFDQFVTKTNSTFDKLLGAKNDKD